MHDPRTIPTNRKADLGNVARFGLSSSVERAVTMTATRKARTILIRGAADSSAWQVAGAAPKAKRGQRVRPFTTPDLSPVLAGWPEKHVRPGWTKRLHVGERADKSPRRYGIQSRAPRGEGNRVIFRT
jgi:hypothetical protein